MFDTERWTEKYGDPGFHRHVSSNPTYLASGIHFMLGRDCQESWPTNTETHESHLVAFQYHTLCLRAGILLGQVSWVS